MNVRELKESLKDLDGDGIVFFKDNEGHFCVTQSAEPMVLAIPDWGSVGPPKYEDCVVIK